MFYNSSLIIFKAKILNPSANRRESLYHAQNSVQFYNAGLKMWGLPSPPQKKNWGGEKHANFGRLWTPSHFEHKYLRNG